MFNRRQIIKLFVFCGGLALTFFNSSINGIGLLFAAAKRRLLHKGTPMSELMHDDPAKIDTRNLETTPIDEFDVMGETDFSVNLDEWRLEISGAVKRPASFTYQELLNRPAIERNVLLICSGFFAYNGLWKGFSVADLLRELGYDPKARRVKFSGSAGFRRKNLRYDMEEVMSDKVFIAYAVNGQPLPQRHGFPLRLVADDHLGRRCVKYINQVTVTL